MTHRMCYKDAVRQVKEDLEQVVPMMMKKSKPKVVAEKAGKGRRTRGHLNRPKQELNRPKQEHVIYSGFKLGDFIKKEKIVSSKKEGSVSTKKIFKEKKSTERVPNIAKRSNFAKENKDNLLNSAPKKTNFYEENKDKLFSTAPKKANFDKENKDKLFSTAPKKTNFYEENKDKLFSTAPKKANFDKENKNKLFSTAPKKANFNKENKDKLFSTAPKKANFDKENKDKLFSTAPKKTNFYEENKDKLLNSAPKKANFDKENKDKLSKNSSKKNKKQADYVPKLFGGWGGRTGGRDEMVTVSNDNRPVFMEMNSNVSIQKKATERRPCSLKEDCPAFKRHLASEQEKIDMVPTKKENNVKTSVLTKANTKNQNKKDCMISEKGKEVLSKKGRRAPAEQSQEHVKIHLDDESYFLAEVQLVKVESLVKLRQKKLSSLKKEFEDLVLEQLMRPPIIPNSQDVKEDQKEQVCKVKREEETNAGQTSKNVTVGGKGKGGRSRPCLAKRSTS